MSDSSTKKDVSESCQVISFKRQMRTFKIIVIGDSYVGKTCLTYRFCEGKFPQGTEVTIGIDFREKIVNIDGESIKLQFWDTAGQERFRKSMIHHYYRNAHAIIFVYDMTKYSSFQNLNTWIDECNEYELSPDCVPRILVGNKCDAREDIVVSRCAALRFADTHQMPLFETSALTESEVDNVDAIFLTLAHKLKYSKTMMLSPQKSNVNMEGRHNTNIKQNDNWCC